MPPAPPDPADALEALVRIPSLSGQEAAVVEAVLERFAPHAEAAARDDAGNAVLRFGHGPVRVTVLGHLDTVAGEIPVRREGGRLYGRGTVDAKGPLVAALVAAAGLDGAVRARLTVRVVGAVEEEAASSAGARHAARTLPVPDALVIAEPSAWDRFAVGYKGSLRLRLQVERAHAHSAGPEDTAADVLVAACSAIRAWAEQAVPAGARTFDRVQAGVESMDAGDDGLRQRARAVVGLRLPPAVSPGAAVAGLRAVLPEAVSWEVTARERAVTAPKDSALARAWRVAIRGAGGRARPVAKTGTSDANVVADDWPVPWLAYGPGDSRLDHTPGEHVDLDELRNAADVVRGALRHLAGVAGEPTDPTVRSSSE